MPRIEPFEAFTSDYEEWFDRHKNVYEAELRAVRPHIPPDGVGLEIGVGTGRFAAPLGIKFGVEPSPKMARVARERGIHVVEGVAESLPFSDETFDYALMVTTICFVDDPQKAIKEAFRVIKKGGKLIIGFVDRESSLGKLYEQNKQKSRFYRMARFFSTDEIVEMMRDAGFSDFMFTQTIFEPLDMVPRDEPVREGYGEGSFVVVSGVKPWG